jgi:hypothetical protein
VIGKGVCAKGMEVDFETDDHPEINTIRSQVNFLFCSSWYIVLLSTVLLGLAVQSLSPVTLTALTGRMS